MHVWCHKELNEEILIVREQMLSRHLSIDLHAQARSQSYSLAIIQPPNYDERY